METREVFVVPSDYLLGIFDPVSYCGYFGNDFDVASLVTHLLEEINKGRIIAWGTGAPANWIIQLERSPVSVEGVRKATGLIDATEGKLCLVDYDSLFAAAESSDVRLPLKELEKWSIALKAGTYRCDIIQHYAPEEAESEAVFNQTDPHFTLLFVPSALAENNWRTIPWFDVLKQVQPDQLA